MSQWEDFLSGLFGDPKQPGKVMISFVNRYLEGLDGIKYKIKFDGMEKSGTTTEQDYSIELTPKSFNPIQTFVWSQNSQAYKKLDDVVAERGKKKLVRKVLKTFKVKARTDILPKAPTPVKRPTQPASAPTPAPSPTSQQGTIPQQTKNESQQPQAKPHRPVPNTITKEQLRKIFPKNKGGAPSDVHLQEVADELNKDLPKYKLDTPIRRAHFFGQIKRESPQLSGEAESLSYTPAGLKGTFGYYKKHPAEAQDDGRLEEIANGKKKVTRLANQEVIANKVYMKPDGNGDLGNEQSGDGWRFRGRGVHQTTGRDNYDAFTKAHPKYWEGKIDFLANPELVAQMPYTVRSAVAYWLANNCWGKADDGINDAAIDAVTKIINSGEVKKHNAGKYAANEDPVLMRRKYVYLAYAAFT